MRLRPYQLEALSKSKSLFASGITRQLIALPTGTGKTPLIASVPDFFNFKNRMMVLVHTEELAYQAAEKLRIWNPGKTVGIEMAEKYASADAELIVGSVPTLGRAGNSRIDRFNSEHFDAIICDEAHHSIAQSYQNIFTHFRLHTPTSKKLLLGVTATPNRGDGEGLIKIYDQIVYEMSVVDAIKAGWLVDLRGYRVTTGVSLDAVRTVGSDFAPVDLAHSVNTPARNDVVVRNWMEKGEDRQTVVFAADISHAKNIARAFQHYGIAAEAISGDDPERRTKLQLHREGKLRVLCNCAVLTEGYDDPNIACIVLARPTKSGLLYSQMIGRGTRLSAGAQNLREAVAAGVALKKKDCVLIDVVDNTKRHSLVTMSSLFGIETEGTLVTKAAEVLLPRMSRLPMNQASDYEQLASEVSPINLFDGMLPENIELYSMLQWRQNTAKTAYVLLLPHNDDMVIILDKLGSYRLTGIIRGRRIAETCADLPQAFRLAEHLVSTVAPDLIDLLRRRATWSDPPATNNQLNLLRRLKVQVAIGISKREAEIKLAQSLASRRKAA